MSHINLTAIVKSLPNKADEMKELLLELAEGSIGEDACLKYDLHQSDNEPNIFIFHEIWRDLKGLEEHGFQPHILKFRKTSAPLLLEQITVFKTNKLN